MSNPFSIGDRVTGRAMDEDGTVVELRGAAVEVYWRPHGTINVHDIDEILRTC